VKQTSSPVNLPNSTETVNSSLAKSPVVENATEAANKPKKGGVFQKLNPVTWFNGASKPKATNNIQLIRPVPADTNDAGRLVASNPNITPLPPKAAVPRYAFRTSKIDVGNRQDAQKYFSAAMAAQEKENLMEAIALYQQCVKADPSFFEGNYNLGLVLMQKGDFKQAVGACETTVMLKPTVGEARYNFALALEKAGYFLDAANQYEAVLKNTPENVSANLRLANLYSQQLGNIAGARSHYQKVLELQPQHAQATNIRFWLANNP
jgi:tetratricopeptide (TPR) repeat protein